MCLEILRQRPLLIQAVDVIIAVTWLSHLNVSCWRGTWTLIDYYILPEQPLTSACTTAAVGVALRLVVRASSPVLDKQFKEENMVLYFVVARCIFYIMILATIAQWRGIWYLLDIAMDTGWRSNSITLAVAVMLLILMRGLVNPVCVPPMFIGYDNREMAFHARGRARIKASEPFLFITDLLLTDVTIGSLAIAAWRCTWNIYNDTVLPDELIYSNLLTWGCGNLMVLLASVIQSSVSKLSDHLQEKYCVGWAILLEAVYMSVSLAAVIAVWRGWWNILEFILLPGMKGGWICHGVGVLGLLFTGMLSSVYDASALVDGKCKDEHTYWPQHYISIILKKQRTKPENTENELKLETTTIVKL